MAAPATLPSKVGGPTAHSASRRPSAYLLSASTTTMFTNAETASSSSVTQSVTRSVIVSRSLPLPPNAPPSGRRRRARAPSRQDCRCRRPGPAAAPALHHVVPGDLTTVAVPRLGVRVEGHRERAVDDVLFLGLVVVRGNRHAQLLSQRHRAGHLLLSNIVLRSRLDLIYDLVFWL